MNIDTPRRRYAALVATVLLAPTSAPSQIPSAAPPSTAKKPSSEDAAWKAAVERDSLEALREFYRKYPGSSRIKRLSGTAEWNGSIKLPNGARLRIDMSAGESLMHASAISGLVDVALKGSADLSVSVDLPTAVRAKLLSIEQHPSGALLLRRGTEPQPVTVAYCTVTEGGVDTVHVLDLKSSSKSPGSKK